MMIHSIFYEDESKSEREKPDPTLPMKKCCYDCPWQFVQAAVLRDKNHGGNDGEHSYGCRSNNNRAF